MPYAIGGVAVILGVLLYLVVDLAKDNGRLEGEIGYQKAVLEFQKETANRSAEIAEETALLESERRAKMEGLQNERDLYRQRAERDAIDNPVNFAGSFDSFLNDLMFCIQAGTDPGRRETDCLYSAGSDAAGRATEIADQ